VEVKKDTTTIKEVPLPEPLDEFTAEPTINDFSCEPL
jgi:hypothetical protein